MVTVRYTETYDLSTQVGKMGLIGIHTPNLRVLAQFYPGLIMNHRFIHVDSCDVVCACASVLPADPLQVGNEAGEIAPQDLFNPILYKAVSNDSFNTVTSRIYGLESPIANSVGGGSMGVTDDAFSDTALGDGQTDFDLYYALLGSHEGWKKAMPQQGFKMSGLYPIVYHLLNTYGNSPPTTSGFAGAITVDGDGATSSQTLANTFRGNSCRMPRLPLHYSFPATKEGLITVTENNASVNVPTAVLDVYSGTNRCIPQTYVACVITPPAKLHKLYYRMRVTWTFTFSEVIPITEYAKVQDIASRAKYLYGSDYVEQSSKMDETESTVDVKDIDMERIMTAGK